ncbi:MAG TPA: hypothetical protein VJ476_04050 [Rhizomicrobium sp.]|nr:hypothetical protein [Rhizomicrobium sp.]
MSKHDKASILDCLSSQKDWKLVNVKFFRGTRDDVISGQDFCAQMHAVSLQKKLESVEKSDKPPRASHGPVDAREFVAKM